MNLTPEELTQTYLDNPDLVEVNQGNLPPPTSQNKAQRALEPEVEELDRAAYERARELVLSGAKRNKYGAKRTPYNGIVYDSKSEAKKAEELNLMVAAGEITFWLRQVPFMLPGGVVYRADFVTYKLVSCYWHIEVIEVKGYKKRPEWVIKEKLFRERYPDLKLTIVD